MNSLTYTVAKGDKNSKSESGSVFEMTKPSIKHKLGDDYKVVGMDRQNATFLLKP